MIRNIATDYPRWVEGEGPIVDGIVTLIRPEELDARKREEHDGNNLSFTPEILASYAYKSDSPEYYKRTSAKKGDYPLDTPISISA